MVTFHNTIFCHDIFPIFSKNGHWKSMSRNGYSILSHTHANGNCSAPPMAPRKTITRALPTAPTSCTPRRVPNSNLYPSRIVADTNLDPDANLQSQNRIRTRTQHRIRIQTEHRNHTRPRIRTRMRPQPRTRIPYRIRSRSRLGLALELALGLEVELEFEFDL